MSTHTRTTRSSTAGSVKVAPVVSPPKSKGRTRKASQSVQEKDLPNATEKENVKGKSAKAVAAAKKGKSKAPAKAAPKVVYCTCSRGDDGTPMVRCAECKVWYHFTCVDLSEPDAEEINVYMCPTCTEISGRRTAMLWEGPKAIDEVDDNGQTVIPPKKKTSVKKVKQPTPEPKEEVEESEDPSSEDEYVVEDRKPKGKGVSTKKRRTRHVSSGSESESAHSGAEARSQHSVSRTSTPPPGRLKRKYSTSVSEAPTSKKKKSSDSAIGPADDPARKYCLTKLEELFRDIFLRYPHVRVKSQDDEESESERRSTIIPKKLEELSEEEKDALIQESKQFADELERCVYEIYSEPDKQGNPHAGGKYKDRFRMLQFNLSKFDRVIIHQRITTANISPRDISLMSSTDLADEETKQNIKIAEKEALAHSILQKSTAPRAKITHKGLQDIEDINGQQASAGEVDRQRDREHQEEERRERERTARLRTTQRQRTASVSVPPESPIVAQSSSSEPWGAPPPVPLHAMSSSMEDMSSSSRPLFVHTELEPVAEPEMNLADLINIEEDMPDQESLSTPSVSSPSSFQPPSAAETASSSTIDESVKSPPSLSVSTTGILPFASTPEGARSASFDLNALWSAPVSATPTTPSAPARTSPGPGSAHSEQKDITMDQDMLDEANDYDFDMFLDEKGPEPAPEPSPEELQAAFNATPTVWSGQISMPLDSTIPQETPVIGRQVAGRPIEHDSPLWRTLFPSSNLRIDGRVPVESSAKFLLQMRMNPTKELIAAAFSPASELAEHDFKHLSDFLIAKSRHGLVFPWGNRPKDYHPGRELYIIPLRSDEPIPDYMELLDHLELPKIRNTDYLIGIWVLNKGKLAPLPTPPPQSTVAPPVIPSALPSIPPNVNLPMFNTAIPVPSTSTPPITAPPPPPNPPLPNTTAALAAEVAALTPEQIQNMLRTLAASGATLPVPIPPQQLSLPVVLNHPIPPQSLMPVPPMPPLPPHPAWPPHPQTARYYPPNLTPPQHLPQQIPYNREEWHDNGRDWTSGHTGRRDWAPAPGERDWAPGPQGGERGARGSERGWNSGGGNSGGGRGRSRGRNRGRGREGNQSPQRPIDSGWPRRPQNGGRGPGSSSPPRGRW